MLIIENRVNGNSKFNGYNKVLHLNECHAPRVMTLTINPVTSNLVCLVELIKMYVFIKLEAVDRRTDALWSRLNLYDKQTY